MVLHYYHLTDPVSKEAMDKFTEYDRKKWQNFGKIGDSEEKQERMIQA